MHRIFSSQRVKSILMIFMAFLIIATRLPYFAPEDTNRNDRIDLQDAIIWVKSLFASADEASSFKTNVKNTISTFHVLVGLKQIIKSDKDTQSNNASSNDSSYITSSFKLMIPIEYVAQQSYKPLGLKKYDFQPEIPPPRKELAMMRKVNTLVFTSEAMGHLC